MEKYAHEPHARLALRGDLLDFTGAPEWGATESKAVRYRTDHWLLIESGRVVGAQPVDTWNEILAPYFRR